MAGGLGCQTPRPISVEAPTDPAALDEALAAIERNCPQAYPKVVVAPPPLAELAALSADELIQKLDNWSPAYRFRAAQALGQKLPGAFDKVIAAMSDPNWRRRNGAIAALARSMDHVRVYERKVRLKLEKDPGEKARAEKSRAQLKAALPHLIEALKDEHPLVRARAIEVLALLGAEAAEAADALLVVTTQPPDWVGEQAMATLAKNIGLSKANPDTVMDSLTALLTHPKPRARAFAVQAMQKDMGEKAKVAIPQLLTCIKNRAKRDAMFADGSRVRALALLTKWRVKEVIPLCAMVAAESNWGVSRRRPGALAALKEWGPEAKEAIPALEKLLTDIEAGGRSQPNDVAQIRETLEALRG